MTLKKKVRDMVSFQLAGMSDEAGGLSSHFQARQYAVPEDIKLSGDMLVWRVREVFLHDEISNALLRKKPSDPELLVRFTKLADAPPAEILKFARKWGVLGICKHLLPYTHNPPPLFRGEKRFWCTPMRNEDREFWEPIDAWHVYSRQMQSMLRIAANLHQDRPGELNDWNILYDLGPAGNGCGQGLYLIDDRHMFAVLVNFWIKVGNVRPTFSWSGDTTFVSSSDNSLPSSAARRVSESVPVVATPSSRSVGGRRLIREIIALNVGGKRPGVTPSAIGDDV